MQTNKLAADLRRLAFELQDEPEGAMSRDTAAAVADAERGREDDQKGDAA